MNGDRPTVNGVQRMSNGVQEDGSRPLSQAAVYQAEGIKPPSRASIPSQDREPRHTNGLSKDTPMRHSVAPPVSTLRSEQAPLEILQLISKDSYLPLAALVNRAAQSCWNNLVLLLDQLASIHIPDPSGDSTRSLLNGQINNQSKANLEKKEKLLQFANDQKADFIKLLVLLQWSRDVENVSKTISINYWLMTRRQAYWDAIASLVRIKQDSAGFQVPDPDLKTAAEILSRGRALDIPTHGYIPQKDLSTKQILHVLKSLNRILGIRLALSGPLPPPLRTFYIHDGRATFIVQNEFEMDVSILDDTPDSQFRMVDFRFSFSPAPTMTDGMRTEIEHLANSVIDRDGLQGCCLFLQELVLSFKLAEYHKQALELARTQWVGNMRVELIRRAVVVQYWSNRQTTKSWIEIGIATDHQQSDSPAFLPHLKVKWTRQGQSMPPPSLSLSQSVLNLEQLLRQVIAQDSTLLLDDIYDNLNATPLYANGDLSLEQTVSITAPEDCTMIMQLSRASHIDVQIDAVTGAFVLSPVTEKSERLQYEINRAHGIGGEIASKLLNFRCSVLESAIGIAMLASNWESLRAFKFSPSEIKSLFGGPLVRLNLFRNRHWGSDYFLAISHTHNGDQWSLLRQTRQPNSTGPVHFDVIRNQKISIKQKLSPDYFDRLSEYATGLICLRCNAQYFELRHVPYDLSPFPDFEENYKLPELSFRLDGLGSASLPFEPTQSKALLRGSNKDDNPHQVVKVRFDGVNPETNLATLIGRIQINTSVVVLQHLEKSALDRDVSLNLRHHTATIRIDTSIGEIAIPAILGKANHLRNTISTVQQIHRLPGIKLQAVSSSGFSVCYSSSTPKELSVQVSFKEGRQTPQLTFFPNTDNPHALLAEKYSDLLAFDHLPFETRIHNFLTSLDMTYPLVAYLHNLQRQHGSGLDQGQSTASTQNLSTVRAHILVRSAQHFAIQYFTNSNTLSKDATPVAHTNLVARLEILPHVDTGSKKPMWLVRAALEEVQAYSRASFSNAALRQKLRQGVFSRTDVPTQWLTLDSAAACLAENPEPLLTEIHALLMAFVKEQKTNQAGKDTPAKADAQKPQSNNLPNGNVKSKPQPRAQGKMQAPMPIANGTGKQPQQKANNNNPTGRAFPSKGQPKANTPNNQDNPITLD
ncbi:hypothetical protein LTR84_005829 [Exophiala bonariae]|uniref:Mediator of RNA polymerase II transcription subunit 14 n=1 Tax=Exophiala bonariae TaxID=1690606 RepID=A0AAV9N245_9EURO|nr:hypothetical protein LTR84_005829 [Exophiala bonariae]